MTQSANKDSKPLRLVWIRCPYPLVVEGLRQTLGEARVHVEQEAPEETPSLVIFCVNGLEDLMEFIRQNQKFKSDTPVLVFSFQVDMALAWAALQAGAQGFLHAQMKPKQIARAVEVAEKGEIVAPRKLLEFLISSNDFESFDALTTRQLDVLKLVAKGLSNAQISKQLFVSESTVKQHLRAAYKLLGVNNRTEAAELVRRSMHEGS